jgi:hypothetical protein
MMSTDNLPRVGYDNVEFDLDGHRVVATVIGYDDRGRLLLDNPHWDDVWHVPVGNARVVDEPLNHPPTSW